MPSRHILEVLDFQHYSIFFFLNGTKQWPGSETEAIITVADCTCYQSLEVLLNHNNFSKELLSNIKNWTFSEVAWSALVYKFYDSERVPSNLFLYVWSDITALLMNSSISGDIKKNLERNSFYREEENQIRLKSMIYHLNSHPATFFDQSCINNILLFNRVGTPEEHQKVIQQFNVKKDMKIITTYLSSFLVQETYLIPNSRRNPRYLILTVEEEKRNRISDIKYLIEERQKLIKAIEVEKDVCLLMSKQQQLVEINEELDLIRPISFGKVLKNVKRLFYAFLMLKLIKPSAVLQPLPEPTVMMMETPTLSAGTFLGSILKNSTAASHARAHQPSLEPVRVAAREYDRPEEGLPAISSGSDSSENSEAAGESAQQNLSGSDSSENSEAGKISEESAQQRLLNSVSPQGLVNVEKEKNQNFLEKTGESIKDSVNTVSNWLAVTSSSHHQQSLTNQASTERDLINRIDPIVFNAARDLLAADEGREVQNLPEMVQRTETPKNKDSGPSSFDRSFDDFMSGEGILSKSAPMKGPPVDVTSADPCSSQTASIEDSQKLSESTKSNQSAQDLAKGQQNRDIARRLPDKRRQLSRIAGAGSEVEINIGKDNKVNDANTVFPHYDGTENFSRELKKAFPGEVSTDAVTEYDHSKGQNSHDSLHPFIDKGKSYARGAVLSTPQATHKFKGHARREQEDFNVSSSITPVETSLGTHKDSTLYDQSLQDELVDLDVVRNLPKSIEEKYGIDRATMLKQTHKVHRLDRKQIGAYQEILGITGPQHFNMVLVHNADTSTVNGLAELNELLHQCLKNPSATPKNPAFISVIHDQLSYSKNAKVFRESMADLYPPDSRIVNYLKHSGSKVDIHLRSCINLLDANGINISQLEKYNSNLKENLVNFSADSLVDKPCRPEELLKDKSKIHSLCQELKTDQLIRGRHRVLPKTKVINKQLALIDPSVSQK